MSEQANRLLLILATIVIGLTGAVVQSDVMLFGRPRQMLYPVAMLLMLSLTTGMFGLVRQVGSTLVYGQVGFLWLGLVTLLVAVFQFPK